MVKSDFLNQRLVKAIKFIDANFENKLSLDEICKHAGLSKFHFHRLFLAFYDLNIYEYMKALRLKEAANRLIRESQTQIIEIAFSSGFENPQAFARAFRKHFNQSPSAFRKSPNWDGFEQSNSSLKNAKEKVIKIMNPNYKVEIVEFAGANIASIHHKSSKAALGQSISNLIEWRKENNLPPPKAKTFNIVHSKDDENDIFSIEIGVETNKPVEPNKWGLLQSKIPSGRCANVQVDGSDEQLSHALNYLYREWLPQSGEELRDYPVFWERVSFPPFVKPNEAITEIYLPLV